MPLGRPKVTGSGAPDLAVEVVESERHRAASRGKGCTVVEKPDTRMVWVVSPRLRDRDGLIARLTDIRNVNRKRYCSTAARCFPGF